MAKKSWRKIHFDDEVWQYVITNSCVVYKDSYGKKYAIHHPTFLAFFGYNWDWNEIERAHWKQYWPEIGPADVKKFAQEKLR